MNEDQIRRMLERLGQALSSGDLNGVVSCLEVRALVLSDEGATAEAEVGEIERFFASAVEWYRSQGLVATRPQVERTERLSDKLSAVDVRWRTFDSAGRKKATERSHYILSLGASRTSGSHLPGQPDHGLPIASAVGSLEATPLVSKRTPSRCDSSPLA